MYSVNILRAKYSPETRQLSGILLIIVAILIIPFIVLIDYETNGTRHINTLMLLFISSIPVFLIFKIIPKIICKTYVIGTLEFVDKSINIKTNEINKKLGFEDIRIIKYKVGRRFRHGKPAKTLGHSIDHSVIISIISNNNDNCNIHVTRNTYKDGIKQNDYFWNVKGNIFDILERNKIKIEFERELDESKCLTN